MLRPRLTERVVTAVLVVALLGYAAVAVLHGVRWWISGAAAPLVALLLAMRHRRARFSAYVLLSVVLARGAFTAHWAAAAFAVGAIALLQSPPAVRCWPRLRPPARMTRP